MAVCGKNCTSTERKVFAFENSATESVSSGKKFQFQNMQNRSVRYRDGTNPLIKYDQINRASCLEKKLSATARTLDFTVLAQVRSCSTFPRPNLLKIEL